MNQNIIRNFTLNSKKKILSYINNDDLDNEDLKIRAYLWFNKLISLKYMQVHRYISLDFKDRDSIIKNINELVDLMPQVFVKDEIDIKLIELDFFRKESIIKELDEVDKSEFIDVEIVGWIYQYYISDRKEKVFKSIKGRVKVEKDEISAVTQLFTPEWIVKYMVENSLGSLYLSYNNDEKFKSNMKYYIDNEINRVEKFDIRDVKIIDPAMGSGHILVYVFDLLYEIYLLEGYDEKDISSFILNDNIYGLDIDIFSEKLTIFALYMKARNKDKYIFDKNIKFNTISFLDSEQIKSNKNLTKQVKSDYNYLLEVFNDAKNLGSIIKIERNLDFKKLYSEIEDEKARKFIKQGEILSDKYNILIANPPYMGHKNMNGELSKYIKENYPRTKADLFSVFMELDEKLLKKDGVLAMINQHSWMFLSSFKEYREFLIKNRTILSLLHLGTKTFDSADVGTIVQSVAFIMKKNREKNHLGTYHRLVDCDSSSMKEKAFLNDENIFKSNLDRFLNVTNYPLAYWIAEESSYIFRDNENIGDLYISKQGMTTSNNKRFLRFWYEVDLNKIGFNIENSKKAKESQKKWFPYNKGGIFRKWYGNNDIVVNYENDGMELIEYTSKLSQGTWVRIKSREYYFKEAISWPYITNTDNFGARYIEKGYIFDVAGPSLFIEGDDKYYIMGLLTTKLSMEIMKVINPTMNFQVENVRSIPVIFNEEYRDSVVEIVKRNIELSRIDYNLYEKSWDFNLHQLIRYHGNLKERVNKFIHEINSRFEELKRNENRLNKIFTKIYNLEGKIADKVDDFDITITRVVERRESKMNSYVITKREIIESLISFFVGCHFGRYEVKGFESSKDNILVFNESDNENDIVVRFREFLIKVFGMENFEENYNFLIKELSKDNNKTNDEIIRDYFFYKTGFYSEHNRRYQTTPIYFLFESGKKSAIKGLFYIHRYNYTDLELIKNKYIAILKDKYHDEVYDDINIKLNDEKILELEYYRKILSSKKIKIDLDDGIKYNYEIFQKIELDGKYERILTRLN